MGLPVYTKFKFSLILEQHNLGIVYSVQKRGNAIMSRFKTENVLKYYKRFMKISVEL